MKVKNVELKKILLEILKYTDQVNEKGRAVVRTAFHRDHQRGVLEANKLLLSDLEVCVIDMKEVKDAGLKDNDEIPSDLFEWIKYDEWLSSKPRKKVLQERSSEKELEFSDRMIEAIKYYSSSSQRETMPSMSLECLDLFDALIDKK